MAINSPSNQLLQVDTGNPRTYVYNASLSPMSLYAGIGENQILGQRLFAAGPTAPGTNNAAPAVYMLVKYQSTANPAPVAGPAPVYWTDYTQTTVTGVSTEALVGANMFAGYLLPNTTDMPSLTNTMLNGAQVLIQVAGYLKGAWGPTTGGAVGATITGGAGNFISTGTAQGTPPIGSPHAIQLSAVGSTLYPAAGAGVALCCDVQVKTDVI